MTTTKQRTNAQTTENQSLTVKSVMVNAKQSAVFLVPDMTEGQKLAVVDEGVLKYLKSLLPKANGQEIVSELTDRLRSLVNSYKLTPHEMLESAVKECQDFVAFHTTVNLLKTYFDPKTTVEVEKPFNVEEEPRELTITELALKRNDLSQELADIDDKIYKYNQQQEPEIVVNH